MTKLKTGATKRYQSDPNRAVDEDNGLGGLSQSRSTELKSHWDNAYKNNSEEKLGWYENDVTPTMKLIEKTSLNKDARIINVGAGSTRLIDKLLEDGYTNLIATDISEIALLNLKKRLAEREKNVEFIVDDLVKPTLLDMVRPIDLWIDRAVLHFFVNKTDLQQYLELLKRLVGEAGYVIFVEYNLQGAEKCSGLPVNKFNANNLKSYLGNEFKLISNFDHVCTTPSGDTKPYIYTLFQRMSSQ